MAELILLRPLFPGTDYIDQLRKIIQIVGTPDDDVLDDMCHPSTSSGIITDSRVTTVVFVIEACEFIKAMSVVPIPRADLNELFGYKNDPVTQERRSGVSAAGELL